MKLIASALLALCLAVNASAQTELRNYVNGLTGITPSSDDKFFVVDAPGTVPVSKSATLKTVSSGIDTVTTLRNVASDCPNVTGNGSTDDTTAFQSCIDATPDYYQLQIPAAYKIRVTSTITINAREGLLIFGGASLGLAGPTKNNPSQIIYDGSNDNPVISLNGTRDSTFRDIVIDGNSKANKGLRFLQNSSVDPHITSFNRMYQMAFYDGASPRSGWMAIDICSTGDTNNCEGFTVSGSTFSGSDGVGSIAIKVGHGNALIHTFENNEIVRNAVGISNSGGSIRVSNNLFDFNHIDIQSTSYDPAVIEFNRTEGARQFFKSANAGDAGPVSFIGNQFGGADGPYCVDLCPDPWIDLTNATVDVTMIGNGFMGPGFPEVIPFYGGGGHLFSTGNRYDTRQIVHGQIAAMDTFSEGFESFGDHGMRSLLSTGPNRPTFPAHLLHLEDYFGFLANDGTPYRIFGTDSSANINVGAATRPLNIDTSAFSMGGVAGITATITIGACHVGVTKGIITSSDC